MMRSALIGFLLLVGCHSEVSTKKIEPVKEGSSLAPVSELKEPALQYIEIVKGEANGPLPMVVALHGLGDNPERFAGLFDSYDAPMRFIVVQGIKPFHDGFSWFELGTPIDSDEKAAGVDAAAKQVEALLELLPKKYATQGKPIVTGFSQGGMLSFAIGAQRPDLIQAAIPLAGFLPKKLLPKEKPAAVAPIYALHGDADQRIGIDLAQSSVKELTALGYTATLDTFPGVGHSLPPPVQAALYGKLKMLSLPPVKTCEIPTQCDSEIVVRCASGKGTAQCIRPYTESGEHLLGNCSVVCQ